MGGDRHDEIARTLRLALARLHKASCDLLRAERALGDDLRRAAHSGGRHRVGVRPASLAPTVDAMWCYDILLCPREAQRTIPETPAHGDLPRWPQAMFHVKPRAARRDGWCELAEVVRDETWSVFDGRTVPADPPCRRQRW